MADLHQDKYKTQTNKTPKNRKKPASGTNREQQTNKQNYKNKHSANEQ